MKKLLIANWKMYLSLNQSKVLVSKIMDLYTKQKIKSNLVICPSYPALSVIQKLIKKHSRSIKLGSQDISGEDLGAYTSQVSIKMLAELGGQYIIIGHSECRHYLGQTDKIINQKIRATLRANLIPIICVGENLSERRNRKTINRINYQLKKDLQNIKLNKNQHLIIAYEPIWAIGTGKQCSLIEIKKVQKIIKQQLIRQFSKKIVEHNCQIIYGGSVNSHNLDDLIKEKSIDGVLVGGSSTKYSELKKMLQIFNIN